MNEAALKDRLCKLLREISAVPESKADKPETDGLYVGSSTTEGQPPENLLDLLRLQVKYLLFDLEATRRENRYLRQMLETRPPRDSKKDDDGLNGF